MKLKKKRGHIVHAALDFAFQMVEQGGSLLQKYDATTSSYIPDRGLTPVVLSPMLYIVDPDGSIPAGDYTTQLVNVKWILTLWRQGSVETLPVSSGASKNWTADTVTKALTLYRNINPGELLYVSFSADYVDKRRNEVHTFKWSKWSSTEAQTDMNVTLDAGKWRRMVKLLPMKKWGKFGIPVQLKNGSENVPDDKCTYQWQWYDRATRAWSEDFSEILWLVRGEKTKEIVIDQDYIQDITLRVKASAFGNAATTQYYVTRIKRWYGQFDYDVSFLAGKYVMRDSSLVSLEAWVANAKGIISNPCRYFDMELFFSENGDEWKSAGYGEEAVINDIKTNDGNPVAGILCRELSAFIPLADENGKILCTEEGIPMTAQFPTKSKEL